LMGFIQQGISVLHGIEGSIRQNVEALGKNQLPSVSQSLCNHSH